MKYAKMTDQTTRSKQAAGRENTGHAISSTLKALLMSVYKSNQNIYELSKALL